MLRFNNASLSPRWRADVGGRTSLWVSTHAVWRRRAEASATSPLQDGGAHSALYCFNPWVGACHAEAFEQRQQQNRQRHGGGALLLNPGLVARLAALQRRLGGSRRASVRPSTGLIGVVLALRLCRAAAG